MAPITRGAGGIGAALVRDRLPQQDSIWDLPAGLAEYRVSAHFRITDVSDPFRKTPKPDR
jgi:hypothetical protein